MTLMERGAAGAALILAIALLRAAVGWMLPRRVFGALWWAAVLRLLLPWEASPCLCPGIRPDFRTFDLWPLPAGHSSAQRAGLGG